MNAPETAPSGCVACGGRVERRLFTAPAFDGDGSRYALVECAGCRLVRIDPTLHGDALARYYAPEYFGRGDAKFHPLLERFIRLLTARRARALLRHLGESPSPSPRPPRVLDIGCGRGALLGQFHALGCECHGVERTDFPLTHLGPGLHLHRGRLESLEFPAGYFDVVVLWHVLEHLSHPMQTLACARHLLRPGGVLAVAVPNFASLQAGLFGASWFHLDLPRHLFHFPLATLRRCLEETGFEVVHASTWSADQNLFGFIQSTLNGLGPGKPNRLYALMRRSQGARAALLGWCLAAVALAPAALAEALAAQLLGRGATATLYARRVR